MNTPINHTQDTKSQNKSQNIQWESLREDLILLPGPPAQNGAPTWSLQDPSSGSFFRIGKLEFEILKRWHHHDAQKIINDILNTTLLKPSANDIEGFYTFLKSSCLLKSQTPEHTKNLLHIKTSKKTGGSVQTILKNYIFFRINLIKPDAILSRLLPYCTFLFQSVFLKCVLIMAAIGAFLVFRDFESFLTGFHVFQSPSGLIAGFIALGFAKIIHEFAHAITCKFYGCRVPKMGVAFIVLWPLLWTDTTDAWRLTDRKKRLAIDGAGMIAELSLAAIASILWALLPAGALKDAMHMLAGITWIMTLFVNLNPFMRFDGYYLLSDALDFPNLQDRSFKLAKTFMRRCLWGFKQDYAEPIQPRLKNWLIIYAYLTWIYRFFL
ncbi:MAG: hypothetical protein AB8B83_08330, partial [Bdellovibrionales bacterium]